MLDLKEKLSEALENAKERFTNPLFYSFIISWCAVNWKVAFGVIWYNAKEIELLGYKTVFDFIVAHVAEPFWVPLECAALYTFGIAPVVRNLNNIWGATLNGLGNAVAFWITRKTPISVEMYRESQEAIANVHKEYGAAIETSKDKDKLLTKTQTSEQQAREQLAETQKNLSATNIVLESSQTAFRGLDEKFIDIQAKYNISQTLLTQVNDKNLVDGEWRVKYHQRVLFLSMKIDPTTVEIRASEDETADFSTRNPTPYGLVSFFYDPIGRRLSLTMFQAQANLFRVLQVHVKKYDNKGRILSADGIFDSDSVTFERSQ